jgi:putative phosphoribosyl transferase
LGANKTIVAVPIASEEAHALVGAEADEIVVLRIAAHLRSVGEWYETFEQLEDAQVCELLAAARSRSVRLSHLR